jgi:hypothetical protein
MAAKKKKSAKETVDERLFGRSSMRGAIARNNLDDALVHTKKVLAKAKSRRK